MTENKHSSADHTLHLSPSHGEGGRRRDANSSVQAELRQTWFSFFESKEAT